METESLHLVDRTGRVRAVLEVVGDGSVLLAMGSKDGVIRTKLGVDNNGNSFLDLKDEKAQSHGTFYVSSAGSPTLVLTDQNGRSGTLLGEGEITMSSVGIVESRPAGSLIFLNKDGKVIWRAP
nr:hypothetical protein [Nitrospirota bacterium]